MSNPPVPLVLRRLRGNPGKRVMRPEPEPGSAPTCPDPPPFVTGYAADEWRRVAPELHRLGLLTILDVMPLAAYAIAYDRWRTAEEMIAGMAESDADARGLLVRTVAGGARRNPLMKIATDAADDMVKFASHFGMTPVARARIAAGVWQQPGGDKFGDLIPG